jgi:homocysteine S-methyltransferase
VDLFACETIPNVEEVRSLVATIATHSTPISGWISIACRSATELNSGDTIEDAVRSIEDPDPYLLTATGDPDPYLLTATGNLSSASDITESQGSLEVAELCNLSPRRLAVGVNCTSPRFTCDIIDTLRDCSHKNRVIVAYPNRGESWESDTGWVESSGFTDEEFARASLKWYDHGARVLGGCCRVTSTTIGLMKQQLSRHVRNSS